MPGFFNFRSLKLEPKGRQTNSNLSETIMGYEVKLFVVQDYAFDPPEGWPRTGGDLASVSLSKIGDGPLMELINRSRPAENETQWALYPFNSDRTQEAVDFLRDEVLELQKANWPPVQDNMDNVPFSKTPDEIEKLSNDIEDGHVTEDKYGDRLAVMDIEDVINALRQELQGEKYRRFRWAVKLLVSIHKTFPESNVKVIAYGH
jgi:hypothetical protein